MVCLGFLLLLLDLATAAPQAADTLVAPDSVESTADNTNLSPFIRLDTLPDNVDDDFWTATKPPSAKTNREENLRFEFLHCSGRWR